ncbi:MAG: helix-turn-helix transcriptional regulator [Erysipelotrichaceae bacterium]|nr:helix-turn-helix transcriptional regulator [Erysipelotrichaceae bacterium]
MKRIHSKDMKTNTYEEYFALKMQDPEFRKGWEDFQPEFEIMKALSYARDECGLSQKELAKRSGIQQSEISRIESGERNPSIRILHRLAKAMDRKLEIRFVPKS